MKNKESRFTENDIRPKKLGIGQYVAFLSDVVLMVKEKESFVMMQCPACGADKYIKKFLKHTLQYGECAVCSTLYMNPRPTSEILENFYKNSHSYAYWNTHVFPSSEEVRRKKIFVPRVDRIIELCKKHKIRTSSILEVGAGFGTFCEEIKSRKVFSRVVAIEPSPKLAETLRGKGIETMSSLVEEALFEKSDKFDVIVSFEVIEHLFDPKKFVASCQKLLTPGGLLVITCPNGKGFDFLVLGKECNSIDHEHLNYFNTESLPILIERCGLTVLEAITPGRLDADLVRAKILEGGYDLIGDLFLKEVLVNRWEDLGEKFQDFISMNGLSSSMWIVARKK